MSLAALDHLESCQRGLIAALDGNDIDGLEASIVRMGEAVQRAKAAGAWRHDAETIARAGRISALSEAALVRVNFLTDFTRRRLDQLAAARGTPAAHTYGRRSPRIA
jgi:hypothetical protein